MKRPPKTGQRVWFSAEDFGAPGQPSWLVVPAKTQAAAARHVRFAPTGKAFVYSARIELAYVVSRPRKAGAS